MGKKKYGIYVLIIALVVGSVGGLAAFVGYSQGSVTPDNPVNNGPQTGPSQNDTTGPWDNRDVKKIVSLEDLNSNEVTSGTIHVFEDKPTDGSGNVVWDNERAIEPYFGTSQEMDQVSVSAAETTLQYKPGTYYLAIESSGHYMEFVKLEIPDGSSDKYSDLNLVDYNGQPESITFDLAETYSPSLSAMDVGVDSATTSIETFSADQTVRPDEGSEYRAWKMVVHTGDVDPTTDSDSDGNHDEGIRKAYFELSGANMGATKTSVVFNPSNGIDKLGSNDKATIPLDVTVTKDAPLTISSYIVTFETDNNTAADGDEVLSNGENPFDFQLFSDTGTGTSKTDVTA